MSLYRLTISKYEDDPDYEEKVKRHEEQQRYRQATMYMGDACSIPRQIETRTLAVELTPAEYAEVLRAIVKHWDQS